jgi:hypothetical protein
VKDQWGQIILEDSPEDIKIHFVVTIWFWNTGPLGMSRRKLTTVGVAAVRQLVNVAEGLPESRDAKIKKRLRGRVCPGNVLVGEHIKMPHVPITLIRMRQFGAPPSVKDITAF